MRIEEALNITFNVDNFIKSSEFIIHKSLLVDIEKQIKRLKQIQGDCINAEIPKDYNIHHALMKFKLGVKKGNAEMYLDSIRLYRRLAYCFSLKYQEYIPIIHSDEETKIAISLLEKKWKDSFLIGLFSSLLSSWGNGNQKALLRLRCFIISKIESYTGTRKLLCSIKNNIHHFKDEESSIKLGMHLYYKNIELIDFTKYLNFPNDWIKYDYFSGVIGAYFDKMKTNTSKYEEIIQFLEIHNSRNTYKLLLSKMIICLNESEDSDIMHTVRETAFRYIGDSSINAKWSAPHSFSEEDKLDLQIAQDILNQWITSQFIAVFFEVCINDIRRKKFWLKRSKEVKSFRIFGSINMYNQLLNDSRVSKFVNSRFCITSKKNISAIMMHINKHCIVEFSDEGYACVAYKLSSSYCPYIENNIESVDELRNTNMDVISVRNGYLADYYSEEGRLYHKNEWEIPFNQFLERHVIKTKDRNI